MYLPRNMYPQPKRKRILAAGRGPALLVVTALVSIGTSLPARACTTCSRPLQDAIFTADFPPTLLKMLLPLLLLIFLVRLLYRLR
jgi:hypothetical protein